jgi:hypothetical protein
MDAPPPYFSAQTSTCRLDGSGRPLWDVNPERNSDHHDWTADHHRGRTGVREEAPHRESRVPISGSQLRGRLAVGLDEKPLTLAHERYSAAGSGRGGRLIAVV